MEAERALRLGRRETYERLSGELSNYPLYPYLLYLDLESRLPAVGDDAVAEFLGDWADTPLAPRLRRLWLRRLAQRGRWERFLAFYEPTSDTKLRCQHLTALLRTGRREQALAGVEPLWLVGRSQPDECDPAFAAWRAAERQTVELVWQRLRLALDDGQVRLARYLERFLPPSEQPAAALWRELYGAPRQVERVARFPSGPRGQEILVWGLIRLARLDPETAAQVWPRIAAQRPFSPEEVAAVERRIGLSFAYDHDERALQWLGRIDAAELDASAREWRILIAMRSGRWDVALEWMGSLTAEEAEDERWRYWRARCQQQLGDAEAAAAAFRALSAERSFYGFLAADHAQLPYQFNDVPLAFPEAELAQLAALPGLARARELYRLGRFLDARREWYHTTKDLDTAGAARAAQLAHRWGWHARAIITVAQTGYWDDLALRFPTPFSRELEHEAAARNLDTAWLFAIARQESAFIADARSPKGALGLMQILPSTGESIARSLQVQPFSARDLLNVDVNVRFASYYLRSLLDRLNGNPILATAAYNAGPGSVKRWLPRNGSLSPDLWIETVPYGETRRYLRRVFAYNVIYERQLGRSPTRLRDRWRDVTPLG